MNAAYWAKYNGKLCEQLVYKYNETQDPGILIDALRHAYGAQINYLDAGEKEAAAVYGRLHAEYKARLLTHHLR